LEGNLDSHDRGRRLSGSQQTSVRQTKPQRKVGSAVTEAARPACFWLSGIALCTTGYWKETDSHCDTIACGGVSVPVFKNFTRPTPYLFKESTNEPTSAGEINLPARVGPMGGRLEKTGAPAVLGLCASRRITLPVRCPSNPPVEGATREHHAPALVANL
jgi:hypothetical protein